MDIDLILSAADMGSSDAVNFFEDGPNSQKCIGVFRGNFGKSGKDFSATWNWLQDEIDVDLKTFQKEMAAAVRTLRSGFFKNRMMLSVVGLQKAKNFGCDEYGEQIFGFRTFLPCGVKLYIRCQPMPKSQDDFCILAYL